MKRLLVGIFLLSSVSSFAQTFKNELKVHVITPKYRIKWKSPRSLSLTAGINSLGNDYAPIGHFAVELNCENPNKFGVKSVLTGMERVSKKESQKIVLRKKLGLGSLFYNFDGDLQGAASTQKELDMAKKAGRLTTVTIPTSAQRCQDALNFLEKWIEHGSYTIYGGNKDVKAGEGSGCADFALEFFLIATSITPREDIMVRVDVPEKLIGDGVDKKVPMYFWRVLFRGKWAKKHENSRQYVTPDTNKVMDFIYKDVLEYDKNYIYIKHLGLDPDTTLITSENFEEKRSLIEQNAQTLGSYEKTDYKFSFQYDLRESIEESWNRIKVNK